MSTGELEREKQGQDSNQTDERELQQLASTGVNSDSDDNDSNGDAEDSPKRRGFQITKRAKVAAGIFGGGIVSAVFSIFTIGQGPAQWMHIAQILRQIDLSALSDDSDEASMRLYRYAKGLSATNLQNTRMNKLGNKLADKYEARLRSMGVSSTYSPILGLLDGYEIDRNHPRYAGMTDEEIKQQIKQQYGADTLDKSSITGDPAHRGTMVIAQESMGYQGNKRFVRSTLKSAGLNGLNAAIGNRLLTTRAGLTFHPLKKVDLKIARAVDKFLIEKEVRKRRTTYIRQGDSAINTTTRPGGNNDAEKAAASQNAEEAKRNADSILEEGKDVNADSAEKSITDPDGPSGRMAAFRANLAVKVAGGAGAITALPCLAKGVADESATIKKTQVIEPLMRIGWELESFGLGQLPSGQDFDGQQINYFANKLTGKDENGNKHTFFDSEIMRKLTGQKGGRKPNETLKNVGKGTPFDFLKEGATGASLNVLCSTGVQGGLLVVSFLGGPVTTAVSTAVSALVVPGMLTLVAQWMSGNAVEIEAMGADWADQAGFGIKLAAQQAGAMAGGVEMDNADAQKKADEAFLNASADFAEKNLAYRLFNPYDYRTPVARLIDKQAGQDVTQNMASIVSTITNAGSMLFSNIGNLITGKSHAAIQGPMYDFGGLKTVGFKPGEMNAKAYKNPYNSAGSKAGILFDSPQGKTYIDRAKKCNGVDIVRDNEGDWTGVSQKGTVVMPQELGSSECQSDDPNWILTRWFMFYDHEQNASACGLGDDESCGYVGFANG